MWRSTVQTLLYILLLLLLFLSTVVSKDHEGFKSRENYKQSGLDRRFRRSSRAARLCYNAAE